MDAQELRGKDTETLNETLMGLLKEHFELRMQHKSAQLEDSSKLRKVKKSIARVKTIIKEKQV
ncbi:MAG: 50S ribosomal protein L29 [Candidatus Thioglobus sp.]|nr:MAG: 50S ribosomal protein L29 [Candidatus Thioglobus sp.]KAA0456906.1 MAG: 50S ribosomal protein L29 [Candidatus Thioglobus sp.]